MHVPASRSLVHPARPRRPSHPGVVGAWPLTTVFLLVVMVVVFGIERHLAPGEGTLTPFTDILLGGLSGTLADAGQWSRLLSHAFLHESSKHLIGNEVALALAGCALERIVGHAWVFCVFVMGAVCGGLVSLLILPPTLVTVGASGGVMAVLGALFMTSFRLPAGRARLRVHAQTIVFGLPSVIPHHDLAHAHINYADHIGGVIFGLVVGALLLAGWDAHASRPPCTLGAALLSAIGVLAIGCSAYAASISYRSYGPPSRFIPPALVPKEAADLMARGAGLALRYPLDARSHLYAGTADLARNDMPGAEDELNQALALDAAAPGLYPLGFGNRVHLFLAVVLFADGHRGDALAMARPFCLQPHRIYPTPHLEVLASEDRLCG